MHVDFTQVLRLLLAVGFAGCVIGFCWVINLLRRDMTGDGQRSRYIALLAGCFAGAAGNAEQLRLDTPLGFRIYTTSVFLVSSLIALYCTVREVQTIVKRDRKNPATGGRRKR